MDPAKEAFLVDGEDTRLAPGTYGCGADFFFEQGHLTEEVIGPECAQLQFVIACIGHDVDLALLDNEHAITLLPLADDDFPITVFLAKAGHFPSLLFSASARGLFYRANELQYTRYCRAD